MNRVVRSTRVPIALRLPAPQVRSPSRWPGTARSAISAGLSPVMTMGSRNLGRLDWPSPRCLRATRPRRMAVRSSMHRCPASVRLGLSMPPRYRSESGRPLRPAERVLPLRQTFPVRLDTPTVWAAWVKSVPPRTRTGASRVSPPARPAASRTWSRRTRIGL